MARKRTVNYAVVDIKLLREGVTPETYVSLFKELQKNYREIPLTRNNYLKLRSIKPLNENNLINGFKGKYSKVMESRMIGMMRKKMREIVIKM